MVKYHTTKNLLLFAFAYSLFAAVFTARPAAAQTLLLPDLQNMMDTRTYNVALAYQAGDYSLSTAMEVMRNANDGDGLSGRVLGDACMFSDQCPEGRAKAISRLENADSVGDEGASYSLGQAYYYGMHDGSGVRNTERAIYWLVKAAKGGQTAAHYQLRQLPRLDVMTAGGGDYLQDLPTFIPAPTISSLATSSVAPQAPITSLPPLPRPPLPQNPIPQYSQSIASINQGFAGTVYPRHLPVVLDKIGTFPVIIDTALSELGDAAAACFVVTLKRATVLNAELDLTPPKNQIITPQQAEFLTVTNIHDRIEIMVFDNSLNGGFRKPDVTSFILPHMTATDNRPDLAPTFSQCETLLSLMPANAK